MDEKYKDEKTREKKMLLLFSLWEELSPYYDISG